MLRVLLVYETDSLGRTPSMVHDIAHGAEESGAKVRIESLSEAKPSEVQWADVVAVGIEGHESGLPRAAKRWLDTFGFSGWRAFRHKTGFVFTTRAGDKARADTTCCILARRLGERGMDTSTPADLGMHGRMARGKVLGRQLGAGLPALPPGREQRGPVNASPLTS